ncbi:aspartate/glutamate racemase family protein [Rhizobium rhizogenes]|uniref:maleate cis-trans isomerase family protein n=1 Tax=Rhizobium rhizogenes TaxID=359 RepID=UPI00068A8CC1|nr:aspartate/glutamate racemase family protein [Rhizobium rhizogenes]
MTVRHPKRLGMLAPSSNTVLEPETAKLLPTDGSVTSHVSRLRVVQISDDASSLQQFEIEPVLAAADLLADAAVDLILWNGTAASWLGFDRDRQWVEAIEARTGIRTTTAVIAINEALQRIGARRIGLVTPYVEALERRIIANYSGIGIDVAAAVRNNLTENTAYAAIKPREIANMVREVALTPVDAIVILCTNLAGSSIAPALSLELGVPVLDSVRVAIEHSLVFLGERPRVAEPEI